MPVTCDQFGKALVASGLMTADEVKAFWATLPAGGRPKDGDAFAKLLTKQGKLNDFQSQELLSGSGTPLVLGDYVLLAKIGAGGMGQVFKAHHRRMDRLAAIKLLPPSMTKDEAAVKRFEREVKAAAKLSHPNIVQTHDAGVQRGVWYLVMEYVEGRDLSGTVKQRGPLPIEEAVNYITQAAQGLAFAHSKGVVHRDIKPANLLLDTEGTIKILDMGLARFDDAKSVLEAAEEGLTQSGQVMGTVDYMAPEQAFDTRQADARADVYSLGCSLYRLLTGENVYSGDTVMQKFLAHREKPIPSLRAKRPEVPEVLDAVFQKMLAKLPEDRYQQTSQLVKELEACHSSRAASVSAESSQFAPTRTFESGSVAVPPTNTEDGMTAALGNQFLRSVPESRSAPREDTSGSSSDERTKGGHRITKGGNKGQDWKTPKLLALVGAIAFVVVLLSLWAIQRDKNGEPIGKHQLAKVGAAKAEVPTTDDYALEFDGNPSRVEIPSLSWDGTSNLTIEVWVDSPFGNVYPMAIARVTGEGAALIRCLGVKNIYDAGVQWVGASKRMGEAEILAVGTAGPQPSGPPWHLAIVIDQKSLRLFENGKLIAKTSHPTQRSSGESQTGASIAAQFDTKDQRWRYFFYGRIDEVRISTIPRYVDEFVPEPRFVPDKDTLALYHFDEGTGDELKDSSSNNHHGKIIGAKWVKSGVAIPKNSGADPVGPVPPLAKAPFDAQQAKAHQEAWVKYLGTKVETTNSVGAKMILIPPGEFLMGSSDAQVEAALKVAEEIKADTATKDRIQKAERPQHRIEITKPFLMGATEVTIGQFKKFVAATGHQTEAEKAAEPKTYLNPGYAVTDDSPAAVITWNDAVAFCKWLSDQEKTTYRLPTEAEWEYACRAGTTTQYSFGDDVNLLEQYGWYSKNAGGKANPVGTKRPNAFGLRDMHGNLYEWCQDFYDEKWYEKISANDPNGLASGSNRVIRGGVWNYHASLCRSASRSGGSPSSRNLNHGFRFVREFDGSASLTARPSATTASISTQSAVPASSSEKLFIQDPAFQQGMKDVAAMPADKQVEAVSKKLMELNPRFDGKVAGPDDRKGPPKIENGVVTELRFYTMNVGDISPVRALVGLKALICIGGIAVNSPLSDLSPLQGMKLTRFECNHTKISDLSPLQGMPLEILKCGNTQVSDLAPLTDCKSLTILSVKSTKITPAAVAALQKALPNCKIEWDDDLVQVGGNKMNCCVLLDLGFQVGSEPTRVGKTGYRRLGLPLAWQSNGRHYR